MSTVHLHVVAGPASPRPATAEWSLRSALGPLGHPPAEGRAPFRDHPELGNAGKRTGKTLSEPKRNERKRVKRKSGRDTRQIPSFAFFAYGQTDRHGGEPVDEHTIFEIGSITKVFTGTVLADMAERGEVHLTDPVQQYVPPRLW